MKLASYRSALYLILGVSSMLIMAGCTLRGSGGIGDVTPPAGEPPIVVGLPVPGGEGGIPTTDPAILPTAQPTLSELEELSTQTAIDATAQASGDTSGADILPTVPAVVVTSDGVGGEVAPPTNTPISTPAATVVADSGTSGDCPATHTVAQGENLYRIALTYGLAYQDLAAANGIANPDQLSVGDVLSIPGCGGNEATTSTTTTTTPTSSTTYVVQVGDNLYRIALQFNMTWAMLAAFNGITNPDLLFVGQVLQIPQ